MKRITFLFLALVFCCSVNLKSQVVIGELVEPQPFSLLELVSGTQGLRLPQLTTAERNNLSSKASFIAAKEGLARGLVIYNTTTQCIEYWNVTRWVSLCEGNSQMAISLDPCPDIAADGSGCEEKFTIKDPECETGPFSFALVVGSDFASFASIDEANGTFQLSFLPNNSIHPRSIVVRVTSSCTGLFKDFLYIQQGQKCNTGLPPAPAITSVPTDATLCSGGAIYLSVPADAPELDELIWTRNGIEIARGVNFIVATQPGVYDVSMGYVGCRQREGNAVTVSAGAGTAPSSVQVIAGQNNGFVCSAGETIALFASAVTEGKGIIVWYKDGIKSSLTGTTISAGIGTWFAVVEDGSCSSAPSNSIAVSLHPNHNHSGIGEITVSVNGHIPINNNIALCAGGSLLLKVENPQPDVTYTWYAGDSQNGIRLGTWVAVSTTVNTIQAYPILQCVGEKNNFCSEAQYTTFSILAVSDLPQRPSITSNTGNTMCGTVTELTAASTGATTYIWHKDGVELAGETAATIAVAHYGIGVYTFFSRNASGCVSNVSVPFNINTASGFASNLHISGNSAPNINALETYTASMTNAVEAYYTWTVDAPHSILSGQGTFAVTIRLGTSIEPFNIAVTATNACGDATPKPATLQLTPVNPCTVVIVNHSPLSRALSVPTGTNPPLSITVNSPSPVTYRWYLNTEARNTGGTPVDGQTGTSLTGQTALAPGTYYYYCVATVQCDDNPEAKSEVFAVTVMANTNDLPLGSGTLSGRNCFDVAQSVCDGVDPNSRSTNKVDFTLRTLQEAGSGVSSGVQRYTFTTAGGTVRNVRYEIKVTNGNLTASQLIDETHTPLSGSLFAGDLSGSVSVVIHYQSNLNTAFTPGRDNASKLSLIIVYNNGMEDVKVEMPITIQDCACCGAFVAPGDFRVFMCHNLGADESRDPFTAHQGLHGAMYKWGVRNPALSAANNITNSGAVSNWSSAGGTSPGTRVDWDMSSRTSANGNPCPPGFRVPTNAEWTGVINTSNNARTNQGSWSVSPGSATNWAAGISFGSALFLPTAGYRGNSDGTLSRRGFEGYYWSSSMSTISANTTHGQRLYFNDSSSNMSQALKAFGFPVRCIAE
jgi:uncharacterized protein (TIGR02145 family)